MKCNPRKVTEASDPKMSLIIKSGRKGERTLVNISFQKPGETLRQTWRSRRDTKITRRNNKSKARETAERRMVDGAERDAGRRMKKGSVERVACR